METAVCYLCDVLHEAQLTVKVYARIYVGYHTGVIRMSINVNVTEFTLKTNTLRI